MLLFATFLMFSIQCKTKQKNYHQVEQVNAEILAVDHQLAPHFMCLTKFYVTVYFQNTKVIKVSILSFLEFKIQKRHYFYS